MIAFKALSRRFVESVCGQQIFDDIDQLPGC